MKKYYSKTELCNLENISMKELNDLLIKHGYIENNLISRGISTKRGYTVKYALGATTKGMNVMKKESGTWNQGVFKFNYEKIKNIF